MASDFASNVIRLGAIELHSGAADPSAGAGVSAPVGSRYFRDDGSNWIKIGAGDTAWSEVVSGSAGWYGTGIDGAVVIGPGTTTLTREMSYTTLVVQNGGVLVPDGWAFRASISITVEAGGVIRMNGANSTSSPGGTGAGGSGRSYGAGTSGGASNVGAGSPGVNATEQPKELPNSGATSGRGGAGGLGAGGAGGAAGTITLTSQRNSPLIMPWLLTGNFASNVANQFPGGTGGGGGGGNGAANANSGGGGAGGIIGIAAPAVINNGAIEAKGGNSANTNNNNCGTGGGGGGGKVIIVCREFEGSQPDVSGGTGGAPMGSGVQGATGSTGSIFIVQES